MVLSCWLLAVHAQDYEALYTDVDSCELGHFTKFVNQDLKFCGGPGKGQDKTATLLTQTGQVGLLVACGSCPSHTEQLGMLGVGAWHARRCTLQLLACRKAASLRAMYDTAGTQRTAGTWPCVAGGAGLGLGATAACCNKSSRANCWTGVP